MKAFDRRYSAISTATRQSIHENFPLGAIMSAGQNNPITLHSSVDDELFASMWAFIAETMVVGGALERRTKEAIATLVSERNECPVCIKAHCMMGIAATNAEKKKPKDSSSSSSNSSPPPSCDDRSCPTDTDSNHQDQELVSSSNTVPSKSTLKKNAKNLHNEALKYAELLIYEVNAQRSTCVDLTAGNYTARAPPCMVDTSCWDKILTETSKAEAALVVALFMHVNRVVSAIMGEEMTTAMMRVPRPAAKVMERMGAIKTMSKILSPLLVNSFTTTREGGFTEALFTDKQQRETSSTKGRKYEMNASCATATTVPQHDTETTPTVSSTKNPEEVKLPAGLQNLLVAGRGRAKAVSRLIQWVAQYESDLLLEGDIFDYDVIRFIDHHTMKTAPDNLGSSEEALEWAEEMVRDEMEAELILERQQLAEKGDHPKEQWKPPIVEDWKMALATVLILITLAPKAIYKSEPWNVLVERWGESTARSIVVFWSLRTTLLETHILFSGVVGNGDKEGCGDNNERPEELVFERTVIHQ